MNRPSLPRRPRPLSLLGLVAAGLLALASPAPGAETLPPATATATATAPTATAPTTRSPARILKVLPFYLDKEGRHALSPSLFDRDAYQFELRHNRNLRSGMRFDVLWKTRPGNPAALTLKLELRGSKAPQLAPVILTSRAFARGGFSQWTRVPITGADYDALGELVAWRASLWRDNELLAEQKSFLW